MPRETNWFEKAMHKLAPVPALHEDAKGRTVIDIPRLSDAYRRQANLGGDRKKSSPGIGHIFTFVSYGCALARAEHWYDEHPMTGRTKNLTIFKEKLAELGTLVDAFYPEVERVILPFTPDLTSDVFVRAVRSYNRRAGDGCRFDLMAKPYKPDPEIIAKGDIDDERHRETAFYWRSLRVDEP